MDSNTFYTKIKNARPQYAESKSKLVSEVLGKKGFSKGEFTRFGPIYQVFMYAFMLGFHSGNRIEITGKKKEFFPIGNWQPSSIVEIILMTIFSREDLIGYSYSELEDLEEEELNEVIRSIVKVMEEYANGGLSILEDKLENNPEEFHDPFVFVNILKGTVDSNK